MPGKSSLRTVSREGRAIYVVDPAPADRFQMLCAVVDAGRATFLEVGEALTEIREGKLYRAAGYATFEDCCRERFGFSDRRGRQLIAAVKHVKALAPVEGENRNRGAGSVVVPTNERQARRQIVTGRTFTPVPKPGGRKSGGQPDRKQQRYALYTAARDAAQDDYGYAEEDEDGLVVLEDLQRVIDALGILVRHYR